MKQMLSRRLQSAILLLKREEYCQQIPRMITKCWHHSKSNEVLVLP